MVLSEITNDIIKKALYIVILQNETIILYYLSYLCLYICPIILYCTILIKNNDYCCYYYYSTTHTNNKTNDDKILSYIIHNTHII